MVDSYDDWLNVHVSTPPGLQRPLRFPSRTTHFNLAHELAVQVNLRSDNPPEVVCRYLVGLAYNISDAALAGPHYLEARGPTLAANASGELSTDEVIDVLLYFGWADQRLHQTTVSRVREDVGNVLARKMGSHVNKLLRRWSDRGYFAPLAS